MVLLLHARTPLLNGFQGQPVLISRFRCGFTVQPVAHMKARRRVRIIEARSAGDLENRLRYWVVYAGKCGQPPHETSLVLRLMRGQEVLLSLKLSAPCGISHAAMDAGV